MMADKRNRFCCGKTLANQEGMAVIISLMALSIFSLIGMYVAVNGTTEIRISDNYESHVEARFAAQAGLNHARELLRGPRFDDLLQGPDGTYDPDVDNLLLARAVSFRNPISLAMARSLNIFDPTNAVNLLADDGLLNTGSYGGNNGTILIPVGGVAQTAPNPYGQGTVTTSRYFVKVSDNNGEASETAIDGADNPFIDGDGEILVRSIGIAKTIQETTGSTVRANSVAVFEARYRQRNTFNLGAPFVVQGDTVLPSGPNMFNGNSFLVDGGTITPGIATIDTDTSSGLPLPIQLSDELRSNQEDNIQGTGGDPSIQDITMSIAADPDTALLLDPNYLHELLNDVLPRYADSYYSGDQHWSGGGAPDLGYYDYTKSPNDPSQRPRMTYVDGDLKVSGNIQGGGVLIVREKFEGNGSFTFNGLILVIGGGEIDMGGMNLGLHGGIYVANITEEEDGSLSFGTPRMTIAGNSDVFIHTDAIQMAMRLLPPVQVGWREVTSLMDP